MVETHLRIAIGNGKGSDLGLREMIMRRVHEIICKQNEFSKRNTNFGGKDLIIPFILSFVFLKFKIFFFLNYFE